MKTVSVVIAAFRAQNWLKDCLDGVFGQRLPEGWRVQVLLGVDGCVDTLQAARALHYEGLEVFHLSHNQGTYVTFNTLMQYAIGELICRFDADDVMKPNYLAEQIRAIDSGADMTLTWSVYSDEKLRPVPVYSKKNGLEDANGLCRIGWEGQFVIRREVWQRLGAFRPWRTSADTDFFDRVQIAGFRHQVIEQFLYLRRIHDNSLTTHPDSNFQSPLRLAVEKLIDEYRPRYRSGELDIRVAPECAAEYARL